MKSFFILGKISKRIEFKLDFILIVFLAIIFSGVAFILIKNNEKNSNEKIILQAKSFAQLAAKLIIENYELYFQSGYLKFRELSFNILSLNQDIQRFQILDIKGNILVDSNDLKESDIWQKYSQKEKEIPENLKKALSGTPYYVKAQNHPELILEIIYPYFDAWGKYKYNVRYFLSYERIKEETKKIEKSIILFTFLASLLTIYLMQFVADETIVKPIKEFQKGVQEISAGNLNRKIDIKTGDEIEQLAKEFNTMLEKVKEAKEKIEDAKAVLEIRVKARTKQLEELNQSLEDKVKERTKELVDKLSELEKYQQIHIGRDLEVARLNREIKTLKEELEKLKKEKNIS